MSYIVEQKIKNHTYVYEATNVWDSAKGQARQKRVYLGKKDPVTGALIPAKSRVVARDLPVVEELTPKEEVCPISYEYGPIYLMEQLAQNCCVKQSLEKAFGQTLTRQILSLAYFQLIESKAFHLYDLWQQTVPQEYACPMTSQMISDFFKVMDKKESQIQTFFHSFAQTHAPLEGVWLDISSLSSYSTHNCFAEWGYNRDGESLPQVNIGVLMGYPSNLPLFYHLYPGSIPDVATLKNMSIKAKDLGIPLQTWIMDKGFFSLSNVKHMISENNNFATLLPAHLKESKRMQHQKHQRSPIRCFSHGKDVLFYDEDIVKIDTHKLRAIIFLNEKRQVNKTAEFIIQLETCEQAFKEQAFVTLEQAQEWIEAYHKNMASYYTLQQKHEHIRLNRDEQSIHTILETFGKMILVTNQDNISAKELLKKYRDKDRIEKVFDALKNEINESRLPIHSAQAMSGKMFITFISLILYTHLMNGRNKARDKFKNCTFQEIIFQFRTMRLFKRTHPQQDLLSEITKKQRLILKSLHLLLPDMVINVEI